MRRVKIQVHDTSSFIVVVHAQEDDPLMCVLCALCTQALNFHGRLKYLQGQTKVSEDGTISHPQLALFVIATPLQPPSILEIRAKTLLFQTKHKLDFSPLGIDTRLRCLLRHTGPKYSLL